MLRAKRKEAIMGTITVNGERLRNALQRAGIFTSPKHYEWSSIQLEGEADALTISASDGISTYLERIPIEAGFDFEASIAPEIVKSLPDASLALSYQYILERTPEGINLHTGQSAIALYESKGISLPPMLPAETVSIYISEFKRLLPIISRQCLCIFLHGHSNNIRLMATDGKRLGLLEYPVPPISTSPLAIPATAYEKVCRAFNGVVQVIASANKEYLYVRQKEAVCTIRLSSSPMANYLPVLDEALRAPNAIMVNRKEASKAFALACKENRKQAAIVIESSRLIIGDKIRTYLNCHRLPDGNAITIYLDPVYMKQLFDKMLAGKDVTICFHDGDRPFSVQEGNFTFLIMPQNKR